MKLVEINWNPTDRQLRQFGMLCLLALPLLGWWWGGGSLRLVVVLSIVGGFCAAVGLAFPRGLKPLFVTLTVLAIPIGMVVGEIIMLLIYFGLFLPLGMAFRLLRRDALHRDIHRQRTSYWELKKQASEPTSYYRQF